MNTVVSVSYYLRLKTWSTCFFENNDCSRVATEDSAPVGNMFIWQVSNM